MAGAAARISNLKLKRTQLKGLITSIKNFVERNKDNPDRTNIRLRYEKLKTAFAKFEEYQEELLSLDIEGGHEAEYTVVSDSYFEVASQVDRLIAHDPEVASVSNQSNNTVERPRRKIKLPEIKLPTFSGKYEEWLTFKDKFETLVHNQQDLELSEKMSYLSSALIGEAQDKISILSTQGTNYEEAWDHICECYHNERLIVANHLGALLDLPIVEKDKMVEGLTKLADHAQMHMKALKKFSINVTPEIVVKILERRLPIFLAHKWDESITGKKFPNLDDMIIIMRKWAASLSIRLPQRFRSNDANPVKNKPSHRIDSNVPAKRQKQETNVRALATTTRTKPEPKCANCKGNHWITNCKELLDLSERQRYKRVRELELCLNCLKRSHQAKDCRKEPCKECGKRHHVLLHFKKSQGSES